MEHNINKHISGRFNQELENVRNHVLSMGGLVEQQLSSALDAVSTNDAELAEKVRQNDYKVNAMEVSIDEECTDVQRAFEVHKEDAKVDREYEAITRQIMTYMMEDPRSIPKIMDLVWSVRSLERIGDRCQNIAEYIIYFVNGKDIRHISQEDIEKSL